jgi:hypothetical protein
MQEEKENLLSALLSEFNSLSLSLILGPTADAAPSLLSFKVT